MAKAIAFWLGCVCIGAALGFLIGWIIWQLGFEIIGSVEKKPGIQPGPKHLEDMENLMRAQKVRVLIVDNFYDPSYAKALGERAGAKVAVVPNQPGGEAGTEDYVKFMDHVIDRLLEAAK